MNCFLKILIYSNKSSKFVPHQHDWNVIRPLSVMLQMHKSSVADCLRVVSVIVTGTVALEETTRPLWDLPWNKWPHQNYYEMLSLVVTSHSIIVLPPNASRLLHLICVQHSQQDFPGLFTCQEISCDGWLRKMAASDGWRRLLQWMADSDSCKWWL